MAEPPENIGDALNQAFASNSIFDAPDSDLKKYLRYLCSEPVENDAVRHRAINRCLIIGTIKNFRFIDDIEKANARLAWAAIVLSVIATGAALYSICDSKQTAKSMERLLQIQQEQLDLERTSQKPPTPAKRKRN